VYLHVFLKSILDGGERSASHPDLSTHKETAPLDRRLHGDPDPVWTLWRKCLSPSGDRFQILLFSTAIGVAIPTELSRLFILFLGPFELSVQQYLKYLVL
jgi:hypothetical protein